MTHSHGILQKPDAQFRAAAWVNPRLETVHWNEEISEIIG
jgi:hypothetical protein